MVSGLMRSAYLLLAALVATAFAQSGLVVHEDLGSITHKVIVRNTGTDDLGFYYLGGGCRSGAFRVYGWDM